MDIEVRDLRVERDGRPVLQVPALAFPSGSTTAVFGPNGAGKTTLLRAIAGLDEPRDGAVLVGGVPSRSRDVRRRVAFAFQEAVFVGGTVRGNLELALDLRGTPRGEWRERIEQAASEWDIGHLLARDARKLSRGEAQRVNVARALALRAPVTLLDEPLAGLDRPTRAALLDDLPRLLPRFTTTTVIVTHDRDEAFRIAERLAVLVDGEVRAAGPRGELYRRPPDAETAELLGYMVLEVDGKALAIPPGALAPGNGPGSFDLTVDRSEDAGSHRRVLGRVNDARAELWLPLDAREPSAGERVRVVTRERVELPGR